MNKIENLRKLMDRAVSDCVFPGGVLLAARGDEVPVLLSAGTTGWFSGSKQVTPKTVFDLASLTKPLATAPAVMFLIGKKKIDLADPVYKSFTGTFPDDKKKITWQHLLCHNSGLPDYRPYYKKLLKLPEQDRKCEIYRMIKKEPLVYPVGKKTLYSDMGFVLLQLAVESIVGKNFANFIQESIYSPLGISELFFPLASNCKGNEVEYAATEICSFRGMLSGIVHDENAFAIGGAAGHAGLFGTAGSIYDLLGKMLFAYEGASINNWLTPEIISRFLFFPNNAQRTPGFDVVASEAASCGQYFSKEHTVGHLGFTGTSFWMDMKRKVIVILLTNRIHPSRENEKIKNFRPVIHDAAMRAIL